jgi:hypothetical protein
MPKNDFKSWMYDMCYSIIFIAIIKLDARAHVTGKGNQDCARGSDVHDIR